MTCPPLVPSMLCPPPLFPSSSLPTYAARFAGLVVSPRPPEAQYQQEFYRCALEATLGHVHVTPEFASSKNAQVVGRIDLFIPNPKWGIEITQEGIRLNAHDAHFQDNGAYGAWMKSGIMDDYIFLDFRRGFRGSHTQV